MEHLHKRYLDVAAPGATLEHLRAQRNEHGEFPVDLPPPYFLALTHTLSNPPQRRAPIISPRGWLHLHKHAGDTRAPGAEWAVPPIRNCPARSQVLGIDNPLEN